MNATEVAREAEFEHKANSLLKDFVPEDQFHTSSTLSRSPLAIVNSYPMWLNTRVWEKAGEQDPMILNKLIVRLERATPWPGNPNEGEEGFIRTCFQSISLETPGLTKVIARAVPALLRLVFDRYPEMNIWQQTKDDATPETIALHEKWNKFVLEILEEHVRKGTNFHRADLIKRRINDKDMRVAVNVLVAGYLRYKALLLKKLVALRGEPNTPENLQQCCQLLDEMKMLPPLPI